MGGWVLNREWARRGQRLVREALQRLFNARPGDGDQHVGVEEPVRGRKQAYWSLCGGCALDVEVEFVLHRLGGLA